MRSFQRGAVRLHILHHATENAVHGTWLIDELAGHGHHVGPGTLYPILHSMEADGLVASEYAVEGGRRIRVYRVTEQGSAALAGAKVMLSHLCHELLGNPGSGDPDPSKDRLTGG